MNVHVENLSLKQNDFSLHIKSWSAHFGSQYLIEGASGSGKTSFLHLLAGFLKPISGTIQIDKNMITALSKAELCQFRKDNIGMIFQKIHLLPHLNLLENVLLGVKNKSQENEAPSLLKKLRLDHRLQHLPHELSLGETQRASVARALIGNPNLILADEPTASLDNENAEIVFELLKEKAEGKTLLLVTHDQRARNYFDKSLNFSGLLS